jgi:hypothetical protein
MKGKTSRLTAALAGLWLAAASPAGHAKYYSFTQAGFDEGATLSGYFAATDAPPLGTIEAGDPAIFPGMNLGEITGFSVSFSGNSLVPAFTQSLGDLSFLDYILGGNLLGDDPGEGIATNVLGAANRFSWYSGLAFGGEGGAVTDELTGSISYSFEPVQIPAPATLWLLALGFAALQGWRRAGRCPNGGVSAPA